MNKYQVIFFFTVAVFSLLVPWQNVTPPLRRLIAITYPRNNSGTNGSSCAKMEAAGVMMVTATNMIVIIV